jgi:hypothetical protein
MPEVDGKKYAYDEKGKKAAAAAKKRMKGKTPPLKPGNKGLGPEAGVKPPGENFELVGPMGRVGAGMQKHGKDVQYKTMDEKQADIRKHGKAKADEKAARKRGVEAHEAKKGEKKPRSRAQVRGAAEKRRLDKITRETQTQMKAGAGGFAESCNAAAMKAKKEEGKEAA